MPQQGRIVGIDVSKLKAEAPKQLFGLKEDTGSVPRSPAGYASGGNGLRSGDGRLLRTAVRPDSLNSGHEVGGAGALGIVAGLFVLSPPQALQAVPFSALPTPRPWRGCGKRRATG